MTAQLSGGSAPTPLPSPLASVLRISPEVAQAFSDGVPVVALESTIFSNLGLPSPANADALRRCQEAIRTSGAVPAVTVVFDGRPCLGIADHETERMLTGSAKCAERDLFVAMAKKWEVGCTTVSASLAIAAAGGVSVFSTGGIGGVHRDDHLTGDISADLGAIARHPLVTVTAGAKAFLDLAKTMEVLETLGVPVLGMRTDRFPAFYVRDSGLPVPHRIDDEAEAAAVLRARLDLGIPGGVVVANPIPPEAELDAAEIEAAITSALADATAAGLRGAPVTPFVLGRLAEVTAGRSIPANLALAEHNALVGGRIAAAWARQGD